MTRYTLKVEGMGCKMCEKHVKDLLLKQDWVKRVVPSYMNKEVIVIGKSDILDDDIKNIFNDSKYNVLDVKREKYNGLFGFLKK